MNPNTPSRVWNVFPISDPPSQTPDWLTDMNGVPLSWGVIWYVGVWYGRSGSQIVCWGLIWGAWYGRPRSNSISLDHPPCCWFSSLLEKWICTYLYKRVFTCLCIWLGNKSNMQILLLSLAYSKQFFALGKGGGGGSCNFQPSLRGGSIRFALKERGGWCVFYPRHFQTLRPTPHTFWPVPKYTVPTRFSSSRNFFDVQKIIEFFENLGMFRNVQSFPWLGPLFFSLFPWNKT